MENRWSLIPKLLLKNLKRDDSVNLGRRLLNHALGNGRKITDIPQENISRELVRMKLATLDDLLAEIGLDAGCGQPCVFGA